jgi:selenocysteine lyase/cysteine desulfurase
LSGYLHQGLGRLPGARIHSTLDLTRATGIVTYSLEGVAGTTLATTLRQHKIITRPALHGTSVRVSIAAFTNEHDLDRLLEVTATLAR